MRKCFLSLGLPLILLSTLLGCSNTSDISENLGDNTSDRQQAPPIEVNSFSSERLFAAGGGGCGMSLWKAEAGESNNGFLFFNGIEKNSALISLDGKITKLNRISSAGEKFYGQQTEQTFTTEDGSTIVKVNVTLGEPGEIESVNIPRGTIALERGEQNKDITVKGDAGC